MTKKPTTAVQRTAISPASLLRSLAAALLLALLPVLIASLATIQAYAQAVSATLVGTVTDSTGASVPGAKITIQESSTGIDVTQSRMRAATTPFPT